MPIYQFNRILVTGGSGFIGSAVVRSLTASGLRPLVVYRPGTNIVGDELIDVFRLDLAEPIGIKELVHQYRPEIVIHLAGPSRIGDGCGDSDIQLHLSATKCLLEESERVGTKRAVIVGSAAEYGENPVPFKESMTPNPVSDYSRSRAEATRFAMDQFRNTGFGVCVLRPFTVYGPGQPAWMFLSQLITRAIDNRPFEMSDGLQKRDLVYVDDVAQAIVKAVDTDHSAGRVINIGSSRGIALCDLATKVWGLCGADPDKLLIGKLKKRGDDSFDTIADISLANELLDWRPSTDLDTGLCSMISAIKACRPLN